ncbi:hypothetical protein SNEBB_001771 [Seison nebaliae]|nr:hypothetical protein SNEBB_001771 [Seison nebaliae]
MNSIVAGNQSMNSWIHPKKVFVGGLDWSVEEKEIREYFEKYGEVLEVQLKKDKETGKSKGYAFILFAVKDVVKAILKDSKVHSINGKKVDVKSATMKGQMPQTKVFVGGLDASVSEETVREHFSKFGQISEVEMPYDKIKKMRKSYCFIEFDDEDSVRNILKNGNCKQTIAGHQVDVKSVIQRTNIQPNMNAQNNNLANCSVITALSGNAGGGAGHFGFRGPEFGGMAGAFGDWNNNYGWQYPNNPLPVMPVNYSLPMASNNSRLGKNLHNYTNGNLTANINHANPNNNLTNSTAVRNIVAAANGRNPRGVMMTAVSTSAGVARAGIKMEGVDGQTVSVTGATGDPAWIKNETPFVYQQPTTQLQWDVSQSQHMPQHSYENSYSYHTAPNSSTQIIPGQVNTQIPTEYSHHWSGGVNGQ